MFEIRNFTKPMMKKYAILASVSVLLVLSLILLMAAWSNNAVTINDGENTINVKTAASKVSEVLEEAGITLGDFDRVLPGRNDAVTNNMSITVYRAVKVSVSDEGHLTEYMSSGQTVQEVLNETGYTLYENDRAVPSVDSKVTADMIIEVRRAKDIKIIDSKGERTVKSSALTVGDLLSEEGIPAEFEESVNLDKNVKLKEGMKIKVYDVKVEYEEATETISYTTEKRNNSSLAKGTTKVSQAGKNGLKKVTYEVKYRNGVKIGRTAVNTETVQEPVKKIVEVGTKAVSAPKKATFTQGAADKNFSYSKVITCNASAYDLSYESCGKTPDHPYYGITASGMKAQYGVVAVDPSVIPLGTRLYIEAVDGSWTYGYCVAGDTGGAIKGNRIDLFYNSRAEALAFGRRQANVYILN